MSTACLEQTCINVQVYYNHNYDFSLTWLETLDVKENKLQPLNVKQPMIAI